MLQSHRRKITVIAWSFWSARSSSHSALLCPSFPTWQNTMRYLVDLHLNLRLRDFPGGLVVKNLPSNAGVTGSIPGWETKTPRAMRQLSLCTTTREAPTCCKQRNPEQPKKQKSSPTTKPFKLKRVRKEKLSYRNTLLGDTATCFRVNISDNVVNSKFARKKLAKGSMSFFEYLVKMK